MRYQKIYIQIWADEKFTKLSSPAQRFFLYLLTSPHSNLIGLYVLKNGYILSDLNISQDTLNKCFDECLQKDLIMYDKDTSFLFIRKYLRHNPITNPNQLKAGIKILQSLPKSYIIQEFKGYLEGLQEGLTKGLLEGLLYTVTASVTVKKEIVKRKQKKIKTPISDDFKISDAVKKWAEEKGFENLQEHLESFISKCKAKGYEYLDWESAFREAIRGDWAKVNIKRGKQKSLNASGHELKILL